jgi:predicted transcriptional regulator
MMPMTHHVPARRSVLSHLLVITLCFLLPISVAEAKKEKPKSEDLAAMWKIIEKQQKQIEELTKKVQDQDAGRSADSKESTKIVSNGTQDKPGATSAPITTTLKGPKTENERKTDILASEVEKLKTQLNIPDKRDYKAEYGLGPAASGVYRVNRGLSIGGYGEWAYSNYNDGLKSTVDNMRTVMYVGYKFNDWILMNTEFEYEHATTGTGAEARGEASVEFSYLDFQLRQYANIRTGLMLVPMGFINEIHEGPTFHGNYRPQVEQIIIPSTWREIGAGLYGQLAPGLQYRMYGMNGLDAEGFTSNGIREGSHEGSLAPAQDFAFTGRLDYDMPFVPGLLIGGSGWVGNSGQGTAYSSQRYGLQALSVFTQLYEGHIQWRWRGLEMRALGAVGSIGNAAQLSAAKGRTIGSQNYGWYTELAYNLMPILWPENTHYLAPFFRYEAYNTLAQVPTGFTNYGGLYDRWIYQAGLTYKPIENVAVKLDYQNFNSQAKKLPDQFNLGVAFMY